MLPMRSIEEDVSILSNILYDISYDIYKLEAPSIAVVPNLWVMTPI